MASLIDELNSLLARERGVAEAMETLTGELHATDPDLADSGKIVLENALWSCSGLYHRVTQLGATPTADTLEFAQRMDDKPDIKSRIEMVCREQKRDRELIKGILKRDDLDEVTRDFLEDMLKVHRGTADWCDSTLQQWKRDI